MRRSERLPAFPTAAPAVLLGSAESGSELVELVDASGTLVFVSMILSGEAIRELLAPRGSGFAPDAGARNKNATAKRSAEHDREALLKA